MALLKMAHVLTLSIATALAFQNGAAPNSSKPQSKPSEQQKSAPGLATPTPQKEPSADRTASDIQILTDTMGLDLGPYLKRTLLKIKEEWYKTIPESAQAPIMKKGDVAIEFSILKDGKTAGLKVQKSSGDVALDRAAYAAISFASPFDSLPVEFAGPYVRIRIKFYYNPEKDPTTSAQPK